MAALETIDEYNICVKPTPLPRVQKIRSPCTSFKDLVQNSTLYVDKSLLIRWILEHESIVSFTYPPKWGKSTALSMLSEFLGQRVNSGEVVDPRNTWAYEYFKFGKVMHEDGTAEELKKPPLVSECESFVDQHLGKYPIIYIDLSTVKPKSDDFSGFIEAFGETISKVFQQHDYMIDIMEKLIASDQVTPGISKTRLENYLNKFKVYLKPETFNVPQMIRSLEYLSMLLSWHFRQEVFIFIDNYDHWVKIMYAKVTPEQIDKIHNFLANFLTKTLTNNTSIRNAVLTGTLGFKVCFPHPNFCHISDYNLLERNPTPVFGFAEDEVVQLLKITRWWISWAKEWYGGYNTVVDDSECMKTLYNPWSMAAYVNEGLIGVYWRDTDEINILQHPLEGKWLRNLFHALTCDDASVQVELQPLALRYFGKRNYFHETMTLIFNGRIELNVGMYIITTMMLCANGYLTLNNSPSYTQKGTTYQYRLPNEEIKIKIWKLIRSQYISKNPFVENENQILVVREAKTSLINFIESEAKLSHLKQDLKNNLNKLIKQINESSYYNTNDSFCKNTIHYAPLILSFEVKVENDNDARWKVSHDENELNPKRFMLFYKKNYGVVFEQHRFYEDQPRLEVKWQDEMNVTDKQDLLRSFNLKLGTDRLKLCYISCS